MNAVRLERGYANLETHSQDPFSPHPAFPEWSTHDIYPHSFWGSMRRVAVKRRYFMPSLENEYLRVTVAPDIGGRIWDVYDKIGKRHLANYNTGVRSYNSGNALNYTTGGIEVNYPISHSCSSNLPMEVGFEQGADGSAAIVIGEYDRVWRTRWSMAVRLYPGKSFVEQRVRIYNRTPFDSRYMYWNNCGFVLRPGTRYIFPESEGAMHGQEHSTFSWPRWRHHDMSLFRDLPPQALGLYFLNAREPFFGYYDEQESFGLVHYGDLSDVPGKKYWTWGSDPEMIERYRKTHHTLNEVYGEIQAGRLAIQEHLDRMPPESECQWSERWFPVRDTGVFNGAGPGAAIGAEVLDSSARASRLRVRIMANAAYPRARLRVASDGLAPVDQAVAVSPDKAVDRTLSFKGAIGPDRHTAIILFDSEAGILATCRLRHPSSRDSWREVVEVKPDLQPVGADQLFAAAEKVARDWGNHDCVPAYRKVLQADHGYGPAHLELGKIELTRGLIREAVTHLESACRRNEDSLEARYFYGLALREAGRLDEARKAFELAARYDGEMRARVRLAELSMRAGDWHQALAQLDRVAAAQPLLTRPCGLRAACLRKCGRLKEAAAEIASARKIDSADPFLQYEAMFIASAAQGKSFPKRALKALMDGVRGLEPPLMEAAFDYLAAGLLEEAARVLKSIPRAGMLSTFVLAWIREQTGKRAESRALLARACRLDPAYQNPWQLELVAVLKWAMERMPESPRPVWQLGNLYMARRRTEEAVALWRQAERLGETHYLLFAGLGFYERRVGRSEKRALAYFRKADRISNADLYMMHETASSFRALKKRREARRYLEERMKCVLDSPRLAHDLLGLYLEANDFSAFDALIEKCDFPINWHVRGPHHLWARRQIKEPMVLMGAGRDREALEALLHPKLMPGRLGAVMVGDFEDERRYYHIGCLYAKQGKPEEARAWWEKALAIPYFTGYEPAGSFHAWSRRYFHALCLQKLGRPAEAGAFFDAIASLAESPSLPLRARQRLMELAERGRFAPDDKKDSAALAAIAVATRAEL